MIPSKLQEPTFKKGVQFQIFAVGVRTFRKFDLGANIRGVNLISGEKLHEFEIIYRKRGCFAPLTSPLLACFAQYKICDQAVHKFFILQPIK